MNKVDMHTHILPDIDDGSPDVDISISLIDKLRDHGVTTIALTPHFYSNQESLSGFLERRRKSYDELMAENIQNMKFSLGAEVFVTEKIFNASNLEVLCYELTDYMLSEFSYSSSFTGGSFQQLLQLTKTYKVKPLIAHIERYPALMKDPKKIERLINMGCYMQINLSSLSVWRTGKKLLKYIEEGLVHVVGTDTHSFSKGSDYDTGFQIIEKKLGSSYCEKLTQNAERMLAGKTLK